MIVVWTRVNFEAWLKLVDEALRRLGADFGIDGLPNCPYAAWYEGYYKPEHAARAAIAQATGKRTG